MAATNVDLALYERLLKNRQDVYVRMAALIKERAEVKKQKLDLVLELGKINQQLGYLEGQQSRVLDDKDKYWTEEERTCLDRPSKARTMLC